MCEAGPTQEELLHLLQNCDLAGASRSTSAVSSRTPSPSPSLMSIMHPGYKPALPVSHTGTPISTPLMHHHTAAELQLLPDTQNSTGTAGRLSGMFSGSNLSLPQTSGATSEELPHTKSMGTVQTSCEGGTSYALRPLNDYPSHTIPPSTSVLHNRVESPPPRASSNRTTDTNHLRRVCSDSTSPGASSRMTSPSSFSSSHETVRRMSLELLDTITHSSTVTPSASSRTASLSPELHSNDDGADDSSYV